MIQADDTLASKYLHKLSHDLKVIEDFDPLFQIVRLDLSLDHVDRVACNPRKSSRNRACKELMEIVGVVSVSAPVIPEDFLIENKVERISDDLADNQGHAALENVSEARDSVGLLENVHVARVEPVFLALLDLELDFEQVVGPTNEGI